MVGMMHFLVVLTIYEICLVTSQKWKEKKSRKLVVNIQVIINSFVKPKIFYYQIRVMNVIYDKGLMIFVSNSNVIYISFDSCVTISLLCNNMWTAYAIIFYFYSFSIVYFDKSMITIFSGNFCIDKTLFGVRILHPNCK